MNSPLLYGASTFEIQMVLEWCEEIFQRSSESTFIQTCACDTRCMDVHIDEKSEILSKFQVFLFYG